MSDGYQFFEEIQKDQLNGKDDYVYEPFNVIKDDALGYDGVDPFSEPFSLNDFGQGDSTSDDDDGLLDSILGGAGKFWSGLSGSGQAGFISAVGGLVSGFANQSAQKDAQKYATEARNQTNAFDLEKQRRQNEYQDKVRREVFNQRLASIGGKLDANGMPVSGAPAAYDGTAAKRLQDSFSKDFALTQKSGSLLWGR